MSGIPCWPNGYSGRDWDCDETIPDASYETMKRYGWGFTFAPDRFSGSGEGAFYACPEHRSDCDEEQRQAARTRSAAAKQEDRTDGC